MPKVQHIRHDSQVKNRPYPLRSFWPRDSSSGAAGTVLDMTMLGDGIYHCIYSVVVQVGQNDQEFAMQVDTGSSDIWIASTSCQSRPSCTSFSGPKYDSSSARSTNATFDVSYHRGRVQGNVFIDSLKLADYTIDAQALASATEIENEVLNTGKGFSGLIGLALQPNSIIAEQLGSATDGATLTSHLLDQSTSRHISPTRKFISLLLERPYHPDVASKLGLGQHPTLPKSLDPSRIRYTDVISSSHGPLFWRVPLTSITIDLGGVKSSITLTATSARGLASIWPVAVFDSGGTDMITTRQIANAFYGTWGFGPGKFDGVYYVPCDLVMNVTFTFGSGDAVEVPIHPLDLSNPISTEPGSATCVGSLQATDEPIPQGDIILGASFLRNIYTVLSYESSAPRLGILPFTDQEVARNEFQTMRINHQPIGTGLSPSQRIEHDARIPATASPKGGPLASTGLKVLMGIISALVVISIGLWIGLRFLKKRWKVKGGEAASKDGYSVEDSSNGMRDKSFKSKLEVNGVAPEEAFTAFGGSSH